MSSLMGEPKAQALSAFDTAEAYFCSLNNSQLALSEFRTLFKNWLKNQRRTLGDWDLKTHSISFKALGLFAPQKSWDEPKLSQFLERHDVLFSAISDKDLIFKKCLKSELILNPSLKVLEAPTNSPTQIPDTLIVPCVLADRNGHRIGRGGGFYDRYLCQYPKAIRIGVLHSSRLFNQLPKHWIHDNDQRLDALVTESEFIQFESLKEKQK